MNIRKNTLWRVPVFCVIAGYIRSYVTFYAFSNFAMVILPDGTVTHDETRILIISWVVFLGLLLFGGLVVLRSMTRKEIFCSASIMVFYYIALAIIERVFNLTTGPAILAMMNLYMPFEWCSAIAQLYWNVLGASNTLISAVLRVVPVYLFVLFGKREAEASKNSN